MAEHLQPFVQALDRRGNGPLEAQLVRNVQPRQDADGDGVSFFVHFKNFGAQCDEWISTASGRLIFGTTPPEAGADVRADAQAGVVAPPPALDNAAQAGIGLRSKSLSCHAPGVWFTLSDHAINDRIRKILTGLYVLSIEFDTGGLVWEGIRKCQLTIINFDAC